MRRGTKTLAIALAAAFGAGIALSAGLALAGDPPAAAGMPPLQKQAKHPFFDGLAGSWTTVSEGMFGAGKGKATWGTAVGGTAITESYENHGDGAPAEATFYGFGLYKISDDGKSLTAWWLDSHSAEPLKLSGPLTATSYDISGTSAKGTLRLTFKKEGAGYEFTMVMNGTEIMTEAYTKAK